MTFSSVALSWADVEDVVATAAGVTGLRAEAGGGAACWRVAGAIAEAGALNVVGEDAGVVDVAVVLLVALPVLSAAFGTTFRAIGRAFGRGTFDLALDSPAHADPMTSTSADAIAVERNAFARTYEVTAFLCGESQDPYALGDS